MRTWENPKLLAKILKCFMRQCFGKDVSNLFLCAKIFKLDIILGDRLYNEMIFDQNVLCFGMHHKILGDTDGTSVIAKYGNMLI